MKYQSKLAMYAAPVILAAASIIGCRAPNSLEAYIQKMDDNQQQQALNFLGGNPDYKGPTIADINSLAQAVDKLERVGPLANAQTLLSRQQQHEAKTGQSIADIRSDIRGYQTEIDEKVHGMEVTLSGQQARIGLPSDDKNEGRPSGIYQDRERIGQLEGISRRERTLRTRRGVVTNAYQTLEAAALAHHNSLRRAYDTEHKWGSTDDVKPDVTPEERLAAFRRFRSTYNTHVETLSTLQTNIEAAWGQHQSFMYGTEFVAFETTLRSIQSNDATTAYDKINLLNTAATTYIEAIRSRTAREHSGSSDKSTRKEKKTKPVDGKKRKKRRVE